MVAFTLSGKALADFAELVAHAHREHSAAHADKIENRIFSAFADLRDGRALGHRRADLTNKNVLFYLVPPYLVVFRQSRQMVTILRILHSARDIGKML